MRPTSPRRCARGSWAATDPEIVRAALTSLKAELPESWESIRPTVHEGRIFLEGHVQWQFQRQRAESAVRRMPGIMGVRNSIELAPSVEPKEVARCIEAAFRRSAELDAAGIAVEAHGPEVTLRGEVRSWAERDQAQQTAWAAPGIEAHEWFACAEGRTPPPPRSQSNPCNRSVGVGGQPRITRSTGITFETEPTHA